MKSDFYASGFYDPYFFSAIDEGFLAKLGELIKLNHRILRIAFRHDGVFPQSSGSNWVIVTDQGVYYHGIPSTCAALLENYHDTGHEILCVAFTVPESASSAGWCITTDQQISISNVPPDCEQKMIELDGNGHKLLCVAFTGPSFPFGEANRWCIITDQADQPFVSHPEIPIQCRHQMEKLVEDGHQLRWVSFSQSVVWGDVFSVITDQGFSNSPLAPGAVVDERMQALRSCGWTVKGVAFTPYLLGTSSGGWGFVVIADVPQSTPVKRRPPLMKVKCSAAIPATSATPPPFPGATYLPDSYDLQLDVQNVGSAPVTVDVVLYDTTTGGYVDRSRDPFASMEILSGQSRDIAVLKTVSGSKLESMEGLDTGHVIVRTLAKTADGQNQLVHTSSKILRLGYSTPLDIQAQPPLFIGLWTKPVEMVLLWRGGKDGSPVNWLTLSGQLVNTSSEDATLTDMSLEITAGNSSVMKVVAPAAAWTFYSESGWVFTPITARQNGGVVLPSGLSYFIRGIMLPRHVESGWIRLIARFNHAGRCQQTVWDGPISRVVPVTVRAPVVGTWDWGNSADHAAWDIHASPYQRFAIDLSMIVDGTLYEGGEVNKDDNTKYHSWNKPVFCVADGIVFEAEDKFADHQPDNTNFIKVQHGPNQFSGYFHLKWDSLPFKPSLVAGQPPEKLKPGNTVSAGELLGRVGDSGTGKPHLHFGFTEIDLTGRHHFLPMRFENLKTENNETVTIVPGTGTYVS